MKAEIERRASYTAAVLDKSTFAARVWAKVVKSDGCWLWTGARNIHGYGQVARGDGPGTTRLLMAHRAVWTLENGPIPDGMYLCHICDNPACVRPSHMFIGTQTDNMRDCRDKGRMKFAAPRLGPANHNAKLTWESVLSCELEKQVEKACKDIVSGWITENREKFKAELTKRLEKPDQIRKLASAFVAGIDTGSWAVQVNFNERRD